MLRSSLCVLLLCFLCGCSEVEDTIARPVYQVTGTALFNGKPIQDGVIRLHPVEEPEDGKQVTIPRGVVNENGEYTITTYHTNDGAPSGEYRISVSWVGPLDGIDEDEEDRLPELIPAKYRRPETSKLVFFVSDVIDNVIPPIEIEK